MLNELYQGAVIMESCGFDIPTDLHPHIKRPPKNIPAYLARISDLGKISSVEKLSQESWLSSRIYAPNAHQDCLALRIGKDMRRKFIRSHERWIDLLPFLTGENLAPLRALTERLSYVDSEILFDQLEEQVKQADPEWDQSKAFVAFDVDNVHNFGNMSARAHAVVDALSPVLKEMDLQGKKGKKANSTDSKDVFGNVRSGGGVFPKITFKGGELCLFSKYSQEPSLHRYGASAEDSCFLGTKSREKIFYFVKYLLGNDFENQTWKSLFLNGNSYLYVAYLEDSELGTLSDVFSLMIDPKSLKEEEFKQKATLAISAINGIQKSKPNSLLRVMLWKRTPKSQQDQLLFHETVGVSMVQQATERWVRHSSSLPSFRLIKQKSIPTVWKFLEAINKDWYRNSNKLNPTNKIRVQDFFSWYLGEAEYITPQLLHILAHSHCNLVLNFLADSKMRKDLGDYYSMPAMFGIVLERSKYKMNDWAFNVGQLAQVCNRLHEMYHETRNHEAPPTLLGDEVLRHAMQSSRTAVGMLGERIIPFLSHARWYSKQSKDDSNLVGYFIGQYNRIMTDLVEFKDNIPLSPNNEEKIALTIGFAACLPKSRETTGEQG